MCLEWRRSTLLDTAWAPLTLMPWLCKPPSVSLLVSPCFLHWFLWSWHSSHTLPSVLHSCGNVYLSREWLLCILISIFHPVSPALDLHGSAIPCIWPSHLLDLCPLPLGLIFISWPLLTFQTRLPSYTTKIIILILERLAYGEMYCFSDYKWFMFPSGIVACLCLSYSPLPLDVTTLICSSSVSKQQALKPPLKMIVSHCIQVQVPVYMCFAWVLFCFQ